MGTESTHVLTLDWDNEPENTEGIKSKKEEKTTPHVLTLDWGQDTQEETKPVVSNLAREEVRDRSFLEKVALGGQVVRAAAIEPLMGGFTFEDLLKDGGIASGADAAYKVWNNPDHKVKTSFMEAINESFDEIYKTEQEYGANYLSTKAKWKNKYEFELAGYKAVGKEMPKQEKDLFESRIKYASDFSFINWLARPENSHMRAAYTVGAGLSTDLFYEPLALIAYPVVAGFKALKGTAKFTDKAVTGGKGAEKVSKFKEAREVKKIKKASDNAAKLATELEKKVEKFVLVDKMEPFAAAQKAWNSTSGKNQIILANHRFITGGEDVAEFSQNVLRQRASLREISKAPTDAKMKKMFDTYLAGGGDMPKHLIPTQMKKMFDAYKNTTAHKIITKPIADLGRGTGKLLDHTIGQSLTRLNNKSPFVASAVKAFEFRLAFNFNKDVKAIGPWLLQYSKLAKPQQRALDKALLSGNFKEARLIMSEQSGMVDEFANVTKLLEGKGKQLAAVSKKNIGVVNYFPRNVTDSKGLKAWEADKLKGVKGEGTPTKEFDPDDIIAQLNKELSTDVNVAQRTLSAEKRRIIKEIDDTNIGFYNSSDNSLVNYLREVNHQVELRKFLGKSTSYVDEVDGTISKSIGEYIEEAARLGKIDIKDVEDLKKILGSRFIEGEKGLSKLVQNVKNIGYMTTIANPYSALIQFGDLGAPAYTQGIINTVTTAVKNLRGGRKISYEEEFGQKLMAEMGSKSAKGKLNIKSIKSSGDVLDVAMSLSQFKRVDMFGKDVVLNSALNRWSNIGKNKALQAEFRIKYRNSFTKEEMDKVISDFANMKIYPKSAQVTGDMKFVLFNELLDVQPITMSQMPTAYLNATAKTGVITTGWGRLLYQLKTFTLKQMDIVRTRALQNIANGRVVEGTAELAKYSLILGGTNATAQTAKRQVQDWIEGGDRLERWLEENPTPALMIASNILKLWGVGERERQLIESGEFKKIMQELTTPVIYSKTNDLTKSIFGNKNFYDTVMNTIPKPIANPAFFTAYAIANFFSANTHDELENPSKLKNKNEPTRETIKRDLPTR